ncbi:TatD family hydrolase [Carboxylicivirga marina]|uniref:TatD family hydrolase n=1 Tax=Carboxylicivirga marina TaxID=2800988 RepID=A0ABS1HG10_9BACT|nr:TatD family hydrolase [Carboxylicivirga marina]MBK3516560.1 TatD family hydrolase [Carboxylicivirga marina]
MYINLHTHHPSESMHVKEIINMHASLYPESTNLNQFHSIGIHPWDIKDDHSIHVLEKWAQHPKVLAIGECGLDKSKGPDLTIQQEVFIQHIKLSEKLKLPIIIHCVKAYSEIIKLRKDLRPKQAWIFHGFNASRETMEQALRQGFYFSLGKALLKSNSKASQSLLFIPHNRLFLETDDDPQLSIISIYEKASELLKLETPQLKKVIQDNFKRLFNVN